MKTLRVWVALLFIFSMVWYTLNNSAKSKDPEPVIYSTFMTMVKNNEVAKVNAEVNMGGTDLVFQNKQGKLFQTFLSGRIDTLNDLLIAKNIEVDFKKPESGGWFTTILNWIVPTLLFIFLFVLVTKKMSGGSSGSGGGILNFGGNKAKEVASQSVKTRFSDVAGIDEAKFELQEAVEYLKNPKQFARLGARVSKGLLLIGPPGTGKTLLAQAVAGEAGVPFFHISGSGFVELFVGMGAKRVRSLFEEAARKSPCIIFIDEIDAVGRRRGTSLNTAQNTEAEQTLNQLLASMDGFSSDTGVLVIGATNQPEVLDKALLRPGRFDRHIVVPLPDVVGREAILEVHAKKVILHETVDLRTVARQTTNFSGADLENLLNEAAIFATRKEHDAIMPDDVEAALDRIVLGAARTSMKMSVDDKKRVAFHESGHALVALASDGADPLHKITIIPHGMALGLTAQQSAEDSYVKSIDYLKVRLAVLMGGRVAEKLVFKDTSTGASNDLEVAATLARNMVMRFGMSEKVGPLSLPTPNKQWDATSPQVSEATLQLIDEEVKKLLNDAELTTRSILESNIKCLQVLADKLLEKETINGDEARVIYAQNKSHSYKIE